jgi:Carbohydrate-binding module 48 (Isoamylase N-terminal domain).
LRPLARPVVPSFKVTTMTAPARLVRVHAPHAMSVELAGDFTDWEPVALRRGDDDEWSAVIVIPKGTHRVNLRVDGGPWGVPPGIPALNDDFGGVVGVLVIE